MKLLPKVGFLILGIIGCSQKSEFDQNKSSQNFEKNHNNLSHSHDYLKGIPLDLIIEMPVDTTNMVEIRKKCVVIPLYTEKELITMKDSVSAEDWDIIYDDYSYYQNEASMSLDSIAQAFPVDSKKYISFLFTSGRRITVDRFKAVTLLLFFNPDKSLLQTSVVAFEADSAMGYY